MTYPATEITEYDAAETFLYLFEGEGFTVRHTNAPVTVTASVGGTAATFTSPLGGITHSSATESPDGGRGAIEVRVSNNHPLVRRHRSFPPPGDTTLTVYRQNEVGGEAYQVWTGIVTETPIEGADGLIRCEHLFAVILGGDGLSETFGPECPWMTYHSPCPVPAASYRDNATVVSVDGENFEAVVTPGTPRAAGWYTAGVIELPDGDKRFILADTESGGDHTLTLLQSFPFTSMKAGDSLKLYAGDDHTFTHCSAKFGADTGNGAAFGGNNLQANINPHQIGRLQ